MSQKTTQFYAFGPFRLDAKECLLTLDGKPVPLAPKAFEALVMLVENAGHLVDKDDLMRRLWPDTFVEEANVAKHVSLLRRILSEATNGREYIETIPKRGYRFVVDVREVADAETDSRPQALPGANLIGRKVSHYRVVEMLGGGGMGLVYKAEDLKLGRRVALKFLPEELASDPVALGRFEREARAASALNHPNICTIHGTEEHEGQPFIVMELLEGESVRELISAAAVSSRQACDQRTPQLDKLLDVAIQVTDGLDAAHRKGIIHRDIKPANIFVTTQGQAKILDFGLAKLGLDTTVVDVYSGGDRGEEDAAHRGPLQIMPLTGSDLSLTRTGVVIGTAGYMSPEQVRGEKLDARTDLFSFGMVLYEMATGQRAFTGDTVPALREAILTHTPVPPQELNPELPSKLEKIINRALEKDREVRYQAASQMRADLETLKQEMEPKPPAPWRWVAGAVVVLLIASATFWFAKRQPSFPQAPPELKLRQLTANSFENRVLSGAISPDGKYLAYTDAKGIHTTLIENGETLAVPQPEALQGKNVDWLIVPKAWFPDSTRFLANAHPPGLVDIGWTSQGSSIWVFSVLGGPPRKLRDDAIAYAVSPDGSLVSFGKNKGRSGGGEIWLMGPSGEPARKLYDSDGAASGFDLSWLPGGQRVIYFRDDESGDTLVSRDLKGGPVTTLLSSSNTNIMFDLSWLPDGRLIYSVGEPGAIRETCNYWTMRLDSHTGELIEKPRRLTNGLAQFCMDYTSVTADGKRLAFHAWEENTTVYVGDLEAGGRLSRYPRHFTLDENPTFISDWTPDSKAIILISSRNGHGGLYKQLLNEDKPELISEDGYLDARVSPDHKWVIYPRPVVPGEPSVPLMRVPLSGGSPELIFSTRPLSLSFCARPPSHLCAIAEPTEDGKQIIVTGFDPVRGRGPELARFDLDPKEHRWLCDISPDGTRLAAVRGPVGPIQIVSLRGQPTQVLQVKGLKNMLSLNWAADGKGLFVSNGIKGGTVLLHVDLQGNPKVLWKSDTGVYNSVRPSPDGRHLAIQASTKNSNMWMMENF